MIGTVSIPTWQLLSTLADRSASSRRRHRPAVPGAVLMFSYCARRYSSSDTVRTGFFEMFELAFSDMRNVESFKQLVSALILAEIQWTVSELARGISRPDEDAKSCRAYNYTVGRKSLCNQDFVRKGRWCRSLLTPCPAGFLFQRRWIPGRCSTGVGLNSGLVVRGAVTEIRRAGPR